MAENEVLMPETQQRFSAALDAASNYSPPLSERRIGTYAERTQHKVLKFFFEADMKYHEVPIYSYIADICRDNHIYEIQTSGFGSLKSKLEAFLSSYSVTVVYPAPQKKVIMWTDPETGESKPGKSFSVPGAIYGLLPELLYINEFLFAEGFSLLVAEMQVCEYRMLDGRGETKKLHATKLDTVPVSLIELVEISSPEALMSFAGLCEGELLTRSDISSRYRLRGRRLSAAIKALIKLKVLSCHAKSGNKIIYRAEINHESV